MSFSERLKERRKELGITQVELADQLSITKGAVGNYEAGISSPKAEILFKIFDALQCDANFLFQDEINILQRPPSPTGDKSIDHDSAEVAHKYSLLNENDKLLVMHMLDSLAEKSEQKKASQTKIGAAKTTEYTKVFRAARSKKHTAPEFLPASEERLERLRNAPKVTNEDDL